MTPAQNNSRKVLTAVLLVMLIIGLTMHAAMRRGMHHAVMIGPGDQTAIAISLSDSIYGLRLGYIGHRKIFDTIQSYWNRGASGWANLEQLKINFNNGELLNAGLSAAVSLGPLAPGYISDGSLITTYYDDMGEVDYVSAAFALFGVSVESLFYLYFTLLTLSALAFITTFYDRTFAIALLVAAVSAYFIQQHLKFFDPVAIPTYWGMRNSSTLCVIPMLHLAFLLFYRKRVSWVGGAVAVVQLAILLLAWRIRGSVAWVFVFLAALALVLAVVESWPDAKERCPRSSATARRHLARLVPTVISLLQSWQMVARRTLRWPVGFIFVGLAANNLYNQASLHPIYYTDDVMPYHGIWHSTHLGLGWYAAPDLYNERVLKILKDKNFSDETTVWIARDYLDRIRFIPWNGNPEFTPTAPGYLSSWPGLGLKIAWHERLLRNAYVEKWKEKPLRMLLLYVGMPAHAIRSLLSPFLEAPSFAWLWLVIGAGIGVFALLFSFGRRTEANEGWKMLALSAGAVVTATMPNIISYAAAYAMADSILLITTLIVYVVGGGLHLVIRSVQERSARWGAAHDAGKI